MDQDNPQWNYQPAPKPGTQINPGGSSTAPEAPQPSAAPPESSVPQATAQAQVPQEDVIRWQASEFISHERGVGWYTLLFIGAALFGLLVYFISRDYFAVVISVVVAIIVAIYASHKPSAITYELSLAGLRVNSKFYDFSLFRSFSVIQEGALTSITFTPIKRLMVPISAFFDPEDKNQILALLEDVLPHEVRKLDGVERLTRRLRF